MIDAAEGVQYGQDVIHVAQAVPRARRSNVGPRTSRHPQGEAIEHTKNVVHIGGQTIAIGIAKLPRLVHTGVAHTKVARASVEVITIRVDRASLHDTITRTSTLILPANQSAQPIPTRHLAPIRHTIAVAILAIRLTRQAVSNVTFVRNAVVVAIRKCVDVRGPTVVASGALIVISSYDDHMAGN